MSQHSHHHHPTIHRAEGQRIASSLSEALSHSSSEAVSAVLRAEKVHLLEHQIAELELQLQIADLQLETLRWMLRLGSIFLVMSVIVAVALAVLK